jgi:hypothetical protein
VRPTLQLVVGVAAALLGSGCAAFRPRPAAQVGFESRVATRSDGAIRVSAAALGPEESRAAFDADLAAAGIQPVWLRIENADTQTYVLFPIALDPAYFSPLEAAWKAHRRFGGATNDEIDRYFRDSAIPLEVDDGETVSGFVFTNLDLGRKYVRVLLVGDGDTRSVSFALPVPGLRTDSDAVDLDDLYREDQIAAVDLDGLRRVVASLPCCTTDAAGERHGDPLNLVVVGSHDAVVAAFAQRGWDVTERLYTASVWQTLKSFLVGSSYRYSPVSPLYVFGRRQDVALQKARKTVDERNHLRLWLAPYRLGDMPVWVGQVSRDIGVRFTTQTWNLTTHAIDPDVDEARTYLMQDLITSQSVARLGFVVGVGPATLEEPRRNLTGDPYFTDGLRAVFVLSEDPVSFDEVDILPWEELDEP